MFWERFYSLCRENNTKPNPLASEIGVSSGALTKWKAGTLPNGESLIKIADYFDCSIDYLLGRTDDRKVNYSKVYSFETYALPINDLPVIGKVAAGQPILAIENPLSFTTRINRLVNYALYIKGDSMDPVIRDGETVQVISQKVLENGEIGIIKVDDSATCKRFYRDDHSVKLVSFNPNYEPLIYDSSSSTSVQILGKVVLTDAQKARLED